MDSKPLIIMGAILLFLFSLAFGWYLGYGVGYLNGRCSSPVMEMK